jgi:hypothetical protein
MPPPKIPSAQARAWRKEEIRYEKKSNVVLWITVLGFVFQHHPNHIDQLTTQADQGLSFGFAFGDFSLEVYSGGIIAKTGDLRQSHSVESSIKPSVSGASFPPPNCFARRMFSGGATSILSP